MYENCHDYTPELHDEKKDTQMWDRINSLSASLAAAEDRAAKAEALLELQRSNNERLLQEWVESSAETNAAIAQRDDLATTVAGLRGALEKIRHELASCKTFVLGGVMGQTTDNIRKATVFHRVPYRTIDIAEEALAASPAGHAARIQAAALRAMANKLEAKLEKHDRPPIDYEAGWQDGQYRFLEDFMEEVMKLESEADRLGPKDRLPKSPAILDPGSPPSPPLPGQVG